MAASPAPVLPLSRGGQRALLQVRIIFVADATPLHFFGQCLKAIPGLVRACPVGGVILRVLTQFGGELSAPARGHTRP